jgi:hypothetical protein
MAKKGYAVAEFTAAESFLDQQKSRQFVPSLRYRGNDNRNAGLQARAANCNVAAQTRIVSAGEFGAGLRKISKVFKYMARVRIREFASSQPQSVCGAKSDKVPDLELMGGQIPHVPLTVNSSISSGLRRAFLGTLSDL